MPDVPAAESGLKLFPITRVMFAALQWLAAHNGMAVVNDCDQVASITESWDVARFNSNTWLRLVACGYVVQGIGDRPSLCITVAGRRALAG